MSIEQRKTNHTMWHGDSVVVVGGREPRETAPKTMSKPLYAARCADASPRLGVVGADALDELKRGDLGVFPPCEAARTRPRGLDEEDDVVLGHHVGDGGQRGLGRQVPARVGPRETVKARVKRRRESGMPSDCKHQSAPNMHGHECGCGTRRAWDGIELGNPREPARSKAEVAARRQGAGPATDEEARAAYELPEGVNWAWHWITSTNQHLIRLGNMQRVSHGACWGGIALRNTRETA